MQFTSNVSAINGEFETDTGEAGANFDLLMDGIAQAATLTHSRTMGNGVSVFLSGGARLSMMLTPCSASYVELHQNIHYFVCY